MLVRRVDVQRRGTGAVIVVVTPEGHRTISHGTVSSQSHRPIDGDTVFAAASITKVFTSLLLADMVQRGQLQLDDPVSRHLGADAGSIPAWHGRPITLVDLATHTAGLPLRPGNLVSGDPDNRYDGYTPRMLFDFLAGYTLPHAPGEAYEYSNVGYGLLGQVLASRAGIDYPRLLAEQVIAPLGLHSTAFDSTPDMVRRAATGYTVEGQPVRDRERGALDASGALHSTANDLATVLDAFLGLGEPVLAQAIRATTAARRPGGPSWSTEVALGWNVLAAGDREVFWKNGSRAGFRSFIGFNPATRVGVVGLINVQSDVGVDDIGLHLLGADVPIDMHVPRPHVQVPVDPAVLDRYAGRYWFSDTDIATFVREGERLFYLPSPGTRLELFPEGEREFFFKDVDAQVSFEVDAHGNAVAAIWHQYGSEQRGRRLP
ncbi:MAG: serine hydrolase [Pseudoxanthomonas sp.]|nr:serine hydrolase [Pseudoxanthomonas sp.]